MSWLGIFLCVWFALDTLATVAKIGKERKPYTPGDAAGILVINAILIVVIVTCWPAS